MANWQSFIQKIYLKVNTIRRPVKRQIFQNIAFNKKLHFLFFTSLILIFLLFFPVFLRLFYAFFKFMSPPKSNETALNLNFQKTLLAVVASTRPSPQQPHQPTKSYALCVARRRYFPRCQHVCMWWCLPLVAQ